MKLARRLVHIYVYVSNCTFGAAVLGLSTYRTNNSINLIEGYSAPLSYYRKTLKFVINGKKNAKENTA
jgi:hypothetical protein